MGGIFISYRRSDSAGHAGRLYDRLQREFPDTPVFIDVERIQGGQDFAEIIDETLAGCSVCLVIIGERWLKAADQHGRRRLDQSRDWVRIEVAASLTRGLKVIPVLVNGATLPPAGALPGDLVRLPELQAIDIDHYSFHQDVDRLATSIRNEIESQALAVQGAEPAPGTVRRHPRDGMEYVWIPAGEFMMGRVPDDTLALEQYADEKPCHPVRISRGFWLGRSPVSVAAYERFTALRRLEMPRATFDNPNWSNGDHPIVNLTWAEAREYCAWVGGRLPTEAQWEYAARGGRADTLYPWGNEIAPEDANFAGNTVWQGTSPHGEFAPNGFNLYDMVGNVWEWTADWYDGDLYASRAPHVAISDPQVYQNTTNKRVVRGGSWNSIEIEVRISNRGFQTPNDGFRDFGLRCLVDVIEEP